MLQVDPLELSLAGRRVLRDVCLSVPAAALCLITGPNGAGKSTLLRCLAGTQRFDRGGISLGDTPVEPDKPAWHRRVALVPDDNALLPELTAREHLELGCVLAALPVRDREGRSRPLLELFGLEDHAHRRADELSFGYRKRLAIALSLVQPAELYLFDEPLVGLDAESLDLFVSVVDMLRRRKRIVLVASHIAAPLTGMAERHVSLRDGGVVATAQPTEPIRIEPADLPWLV